MALQLATPKTQARCLSPAPGLPQTISKSPVSPSDCVTVNHFKDLAFPRGAGKYQAGVQSL